jgi:hypothetical protein
VETAVARAAAAARTKRRAPPISPTSMGDGRGMRPMWEERQSTGQWGAGFSQVRTYLCCTFLLPLLLRATGVLALYTC